MTSRNRQSSHIFYWRWRHMIRLTLAPVLMPRPMMLGAAFLYTSVR